MAMPRIAKRFVKAILTGSLATYATVPANTKWEIVDVAMANDTGAIANPRVHMGGTAWLAKTISAGADQHLQVFTVLNAGESIEAFGNGITLYVSGIEVT